jgi:predicted GNAT superfamily acetyltransferase
MIEQALQDYVIRELSLEREALAPVIELHHEVLPSRLYATPEKKAGLLNEILMALDGREYLILAAFNDSKPVAYKIAYRSGNRKECLYSWLGGVHPHHRRKGLARKLIHIQHEWAREQGYTYVETHTWGDNPAMMILNLHEGFVAVGSLSAIDRPGTRIIMRKLLKPQ